MAAIGTLPSLIGWSAAGLLSLGVFPSLISLCRRIKDGGPDAGPANPVAHFLTGDRSVGWLVIALALLTSFVSRSAPARS